MAQRVKAILVACLCRQGEGRQLRWAHRPFQVVDRVRHFPYPLQGQTFVHSRQPCRPTPVRQPVTEAPAPAPEPRCFPRPWHCRMASPRRVDGEIGSVSLLYWNRTEMGILIFLLMIDSRQPLNAARKHFSRAGWPPLTVTFRTVPFSTKWRTARRAPPLPEMP